MNNINSKREEIFHHSSLNETICPISDRCIESGRNLPQFLQPGHNNVFLFAWQRPGNNMEYPMPDREYSNISDYSDVNT